MTDAAWVERFLAEDAPRAPRLGGYYHANHVVARDGRRVVVRVPLPGAPRMDLRALPEDETLRHLERHAYPAPRVLARHPEGRWSVHSFVEGTPLHLAHTRGGPLPGWIAPEAARLLARLHALDASPLAPACAWIAESPDAQGLFASLVRFAEDLHARLAPDVGGALAALGVPARPYDAVRPLAERLLARPFALCHVDAHRKNLLVTPDGKGLALLDWELALVADPLYDVAVHFHRMRYAPAQEDAFLRAYGAPPDARGQVDAYLALEAAKSCVGDFWRYANDWPALPDDERALLAEHYLGKLRRAWPLWHEATEAPPDAARVRAALDQASSSRNERLAGQ